jgi:hypothetical protein
LLSNANTFRRVGVGLALIAAPLLFLLGDIISPAWSDETTEYVDEVAASTSAQSISGVLYTIGMPLMLAGAIGVASCIRGRGVTLANIAVALAVLGLGTFPALTVTSIIDTVAIDAIGAEGLASLIDAGEDSAAFIVVLLFALIGSVLSLILIGIAVGRSGLAPWWVAGALIVSALLLIAGGSSQVLAIAASALTLAGFGFLGIRILRLPDAVWDRPPGDWRSATTA